MNPAPFLLVDIGNSRIKWAVADLQGPIQPVGEVTTAQASPELIQSLAQEFPLHEAIISSVVPRLNDSFTSAFSKRLRFVSASLPGLSLRFDYPKPGELGADRLAAAVAVKGDKQGPVIVVQCGTATAFTVLNGEGKLCGGVIAPGLRTQLDSLIGAAAQLPEIDLGQPEQALARSTAEAIRAGVILNYQGGVKEILRALISELPSSRTPRIVLTGGDATYLSGALGLPHTLRPLLVFEGLRMIGASTLATPS